MTLGPDRDFRVALLSARLRRDGSGHQLSPLLERPIAIKYRPHGYLTVLSKRELKHNPIYERLVGRVDDNEASARGARKHFEGLHVSLVAFAPSNGLVQQHGVFLVGC